MRLGKPQRKSQPASFEQELIAFFVVDLCDELVAALIRADYIAAHGRLACGKLPIMPIMRRMVFISLDRDQQISVVVPRRIHSRRNRPHA